MQWRSWLKHCPVSQKVAGSNPHGVMGIFYSLNPYGHTMALRSTQPLAEISTRNISWGGEAGQCVRLTALPLSCANCLEIWELQSPATLWACPIL